MNKYTYKKSITYFLRGEKHPFSGVKAREVHDE